VHDEPVGLSYNVFSTNPTLEPISEAFFLFKKKKKKP
jgi:hypothetical protein